MALPAERKAVEDHNAKIDAELKPMEEQFKTIKGKERGELKKKIDALKAKKKRPADPCAVGSRRIFANVRKSKGNPVVLGCW